MFNMLCQWNYIPFSATWNKTPVEFIAVSGPPYTEIQANATELRINKGNLAPIYTKEFDNQPTINSIEIRDLVKQQIEEAKQETLDEFNKNIVQPFDWSKSDFVNDTHRGLPDKWAFVSFKPNWSWWISVSHIHNKICTLYK